MRKIVALENKKCLPLYISSLVYPFVSIMDLKSIHNDLGNCIFCVFFLFISKGNIEQSADTRVTLWLKKGVHLYPLPLAPPPSDLTLSFEQIKFLQCTERCEV